MSERLVRRDLRKFECQWENITLRSIQIDKWMITKLSTSDTTQGGYDPNLFLASQYNTSWYRHLRQIEVDLHSMNLNPVPILS